METIEIHINRNDVYEEVAKATDYTGSKQTEADDKVRDRILAADSDLEELSRFWDEAESALNEKFKELLIAGTSDAGGYHGKFEVSKAYDKSLNSSVTSSLRSYFIASIICQWFKFANKSEAPEYQDRAQSMLDGTERMLYSRKKPKIPNRQ